MCMPEAATAYSLVTCELAMLDSREQAPTPRETLSLNKECIHLSLPLSFRLSLPYLVVVLVDLLGKGLRLHTSISLICVRLWKGYDEI